MLNLAINNQPDYTETAVAIITASDLATSTKRKYTAVLTQFAADGHSLTDRQALASYAATLPHSRRAHLKAAIKLWSNELIELAKSKATPENVSVVNAMIYRFQALQTAVTIKVAKGEKAHTWLTRAEVIELMDMAAGGDIAKQRDRLSLGLLVGAGLRRLEAVTLTFDSLKLQPIRGKARAVLAIEGKGARGRVVPISDKLASMLDDWQLVVGEGPVLRSVGKGGNIGSGFSAAGLFKLVRSYGRLIGKPELAPHDLRRTYAQLGYENGVPITQISRLLGHSSIATTQRYLNLDLDLETTVSDFVPL